MLSACLHISVFGTAGFGLMHVLGPLPVERVTCFQAEKRWRIETENDESQKKKSPISVLNLGGQIQQYRNSYCLMQNALYEFQ